MRTLIFVRAILAKVLSVIDLSQDKNGTIATGISPRAIVRRNVGLARPYVIIGEARLRFAGSRTIKGRKRDRVGLTAEMSLPPGSCGMRAIPRR